MYILANKGIIPSIDITSSILSPNIHPALYKWK